MRTITRMAVVVVTGVALLGVGVSAASAAGGNGYGRGFGMMNNRGNGIGMMGGGYGQGRNAGLCPGLTATASGTLTTAERTALAAMAEEEKMARDVYATLAKQYPALPQFAKITVAEQRHLDAVRTLLQRYGITDPTLGLAAGVFKSNEFTTMYGALLASVHDAASALAAGRSIEQADIADLAVLLKTVSAPDVKQVLTMLDRASDMHLVAFGG